MNEQEQESFEAQLRRTPPARLPAHFLARLQAAKPDADLAQRRPLRPVATKPFWRGVLRWLAPATALAWVVLLLCRVDFHPATSVGTKPLAAAYGMKADAVQVDQELVSSFQVVAKLPGGQPVRFRCRQWRDQWVVTDKNRGVEIEQNSPRVEVVPVRFETY